MRIDRFTSKLQEAMSDAQSLAVGKDHNQITPIHLVIALFDQRGGSTRPLFAQMGVDVAKFREELDGLLGNLAVQKDNFGDVQVSAELGRLLNRADKFSQERRSIHFQRTGDPGGA